MLETLLPAFTDECQKIAASTMDALLKAELFHDDSAKDWKGFEKDLTKKQFQRAMLLHPKTKEDEKLKKYVKSYGDHLTSKKTVAGVPSESSNKTYKVKRLPNGRLSCGCKDWQYKQSHQGTDCKHIRAFKASGLAKQSAAVLPLPFWKGMSMMNQLTKPQQRKQKELQRSSH